MAPLPGDFGARLRAARAYAGDISRDDFAEELNVAGASSSTLKLIENGTRNPPPLAAPSLVTRLAQVTGLSENFFWGREGPPSETERIVRENARQIGLLRDAVNDLTQQLQDLQGDRAASVAEVLALLEDRLPPSEEPPLRRPA